MKTLLLTGATGFLGGAVLEKLLIENQSVNYLLLVRADDAQQGLARIRANMEKFNIDANLLSKITIENILLGDLSEPADFLTDARINKVTHVINCAAVASFGNNPLIWKVNVEGTLAFAERMAQVPGLKRFLHVGTAMSCSPEPGSLVAESGEFEEDAEHLVEYTRSKSTIEQLMRQRCPQLPLTIARPSIVVGHTRLGCQPSSSIFWVFGMA
ncbi:MAG: SDR family oxidoreductase, partial [Serratia marcescens]|nr:SDR family oxidoreductase [Serratia marcescens]